MMAQDQVTTDADLTTEMACDGAGGTGIGSVTSRGMSSTNNEDTLK